MVSATCCPGTVDGNGWKYRIKNGPAPLHFRFPFITLPSPSLPYTDSTTIVQTPFSIYLSLFLLAGGQLAGWQLDLSVRLAFGP